MKIILAFIIIDFAWSACPKLNEPNCKKSEMLCYEPPKGYEDTCPILQCTKKKYKNPLNPKKKCKSFCPVYCGTGKIACRGPLDDDGCIIGEVCIPNAPSCSEECQTFCPPQCGEGHKLCAGGYEPNECPVRDICVPKRNGNCVNHCPCPKGQYTCPDAGVDDNGCRLPPVCVPLHDPYSCPTLEYGILIVGPYRMAFLNDSLCDGLPIIPDGGRVWSAGQFFNGYPTYCGGWRTGSSAPRGQCYQFRDGEWIKLPGSLAPKSRHAAALAGAEMLWFTGGQLIGYVYDETSITNSTDILHLDGTITTGPDLPEPRWYHCMASDMADNQIFVLGGTDAKRRPKRNNWIFKYNDEGISYSHEGPKLSIPRADFACNIVRSDYYDDRNILIIAGGSTIELFDYSTAGSVWTKLPNLPAPLTSSHLFQIPVSGNVVLFDQGDMIEMKVLSNGTISYQRYGRDSDLYPSSYNVPMIIPRKLVEPYC